MICQAEQAIVSLFRYWLCAAWRYLSDASLSTGVPWKETGSLQQRSVSNGLTRPLKDPEGRSKGQRMYVLVSYRSTQSSENLLSSVDWLRTQAWGQMGTKRNAFDTKCCQHAHSKGTVLNTEYSPAKNSGHQSTEPFGSAKRKRGPDWLRP